MSGPSVLCVGREPPLAVLRAQLDLAIRGQPRIVWIEGEAGLGKTTLVRSFVSNVACQAVWVSGDEAETSLPFGVLTSLHRALAVTLGSAEGAVRAPTSASDPLSAGGELLMAMGASDTPLVLVVDDLQWSDPSSAAALRFALRRLLAEPLLVLLVTRPHPEDALGEPWGRLLSDAALVEHLPLDGLTADAVAELLQSSGRRDLGLSAAERLRAHTDGNALHLRALIEELDDTALGADTVLPAPRSFTQLTVSRLAALGDDTVRLVTAGAVLGSSFPLALATTVGGVADGATALDRAVAAGLLERRPDRDVRFPHPLVRGAIYNDVSPDRRRALHQQAAAATTGARALEHRVAAAAGYDDTLADELERDAGDTLLLSATALAFDRLLAASRLASDEGRRERLLLKAVEVLVALGDYGRAFAMQEAVLACAPSAHRSYVLGMLDMTPEAVALFSSAAADADDDTDIDHLRLRAVAGRGVANMRLGRFDDALRDATTFLASGVEGWGTGLTRWVQVVCLAQLDRTHEARAAIAGRDGLDELCARGLLGLADDDLAAAVEDLTAVAQRARAGENTRLLTVALSMLAGAEYHLGRWDDSTVNSQLAVDLAADTGRWVVLAHAAATLVHAGRGRFDVAAAHVQAADAFLSWVPNPAGRYYASVARAFLAQARGDVDDLREAIAPLVDGRVVAAREGLTPWAWRVLAVEALIGAGELPAARLQLRELVAVTEAQAYSSPGPDVARLEGQLAEASGDPEAARAAYAAGVARVDGRDPLPLPTARLLLAFGSLLRRSGERRAAVEQLRIAHAVLTNLGAAPFLATCEAELSACGLVAPAADRSGRFDLTQSEEAVAHLVAQGLTNREAAARLYVSPKTIGFHLGNIYAKLGVSSRRELRQHFTTRV